MKKNYRRSIPCVLYVAVIIILSFLHSSLLIGQIKVVPGFLFMKEGEHSTAFNIFNPASGEVECWVDVKYGYATMDDTGRPCVIYDSVTPGRNDASGWIKAYPKRFTMDVEESQVIRLTVTPPHGLSEGEYWARIVVNSKLSRPLLVPGKGQPNRANIVQVISIDIPFHYRVGKVTAGVDLQNPSIQTIEGGRLRFGTDVRHTGNASYWGLLDLRFLNKNNNALVVESKKHFVAYKDYHYSLGLDSLNLPSGNYTVEAVVNTKRQDILQKLLLPSGSISKTFDFSKP